MNREETKKILAAISATYTNVTINPGSVDLWHKILEPFHYSQVEDACLAFFRTSSKFPPVPGEIFQTLKKKVAKHTISAEDAFRVALAASSPYYKRTEPIHPRIFRVMDGIGWERLRTADETDMHWIRRDFIKSYEAILDAEISEDLPRILTLIESKPKLID